MVSCTQLQKLCNIFLPKKFICAKKIAAVRGVQRALPRDCAREIELMRALTVNQ
jgi:hypothetical protein